MHRRPFEGRYLVCLLFPLTEHFVLGYYVIDMFNFTNCDCSEKLCNAIFFVINIIFLLIGTKIEHNFFLYNGL